MKKSFIRLGFVLFLFTSFLQLQAQQITILPRSTFGTSTPANPISVCQCDTLGVSFNPSNNVVKPELKYFYASAFLPTTKFYYELASPNNNWANADSLELWSLTGLNDLVPVDTFSAPDTKEAQLIIPCDAPLGSATLRVRNSNGEISDTAYLLINKLPTLPVIDSIAYGFENLYTTTGDWGLCDGDSIMLYAEKQAGASYQWLRNGVPIPLENADSLVVKISGLYAIRIDFGACARDSKDTLINVVTVPTNVSNVGVAPAVVQIDNPNPLFGFPLDSVRFCEGNGAPLQANAPPAGTGLSFTYQWITDSVTQSNNTVYYMTDSADTLRTFLADTTGRFYVVVNDGYCSDTSQPYYAFMDTLPKTKIASENYLNGLVGPQIITKDICLRDSVRLTSTNQVPRSSTTGGWTYQWQRYNFSTSMWENLPNLANPGFVGGTDPTILVDTTIKPIQPISRYRLITRTTTFFTGANICEYISDEVRIRWNPDTTIDYAPQPWITSVGKDSVSLCEEDSVMLIAPATPGQMVGLGLNYTYQWMTDSLDTNGITHRIPIAGATGQNYFTNVGGQYYVALDDSICIDTLDAFHVFVDLIPSTALTDTLLPAIPGTDTDRLLCLDDAVILASREFRPSWRFQWQQYNAGTGTWSNALNDTLPVILVDTSYREPGEDSAFFRLSVYEINQFGLIGCSFISDSIEVVFFDPPTLNFFPGDSLGLCAGDSILVIAQGNSLNYLWSPGGSLSPSEWISTPGTYTVTGTGVNGCQTTRQVIVYAQTTTANAGPDITTTSGTTVQLSGSGGTSYQWSASKPIAWSDFLSSDVSVSYTLPEGVKGDTITIYLVVRNSFGCSDIDSLTLIVLSDEDPDIALLAQAWNYFSPNNDGMNDTWDIRGIVGQYNVCRIDIMNRWGSTVYDQEQFNGIWDGRDKGGNELPDGTYYYILSCDGEVLLKNAVTLIRK